MQRTNKRFACLFHKVNIQAFSCWVQFCLGLLHSAVKKSLGNFLVPDIVCSKWKYLSSKLVERKISSPARQKNRRLNEEIAPPQKKTWNCNVKYSSLEILEGFFLRKFLVSLECKNSNYLCCLLKERLEGETVGFRHYTSYLERAPSFLSVSSKWYKNDLHAIYPDSYEENRTGFCVPRWETANLAYIFGLFGNWAPSK